MGYIYKITNNKNGKVYIGKTEGPVRQRWNAHVSTSLRPNQKESNFKFHNAIRKYGRDAFNVETIDEADGEELLAREQYWIEFYDSIKTGYNTTIGGEGVTLYSDEFIKECWESGMTCEELTEKYGMSKTTFSARSRALYSAEDCKKRRAKNLMLTNGTPVYQYDRNGNYISSFCSVNEAKRKTGINHIDQVARGERSHAGGFVWSYVRREAG